MLAAKAWAYETLELDENATAGEIKEQFHWFAKTYHPDNRETGDVEIFRNAIEAWKILSKEF